MTTDAITATQALGVALSVQAETMTMGEAQERAPAMLDHLRRMGFDVALAAIQPAAKPRLNEYGRVACVCGVSVLPENWTNHLQSQQRGPHRALAIEGGES